MIEILPYLKGTKLWDFYGTFLIMCNAGFYTIKRRPLFWGPFKRVPYYFKDPNGDPNLEDGSQF